MGNALIHIKQPNESIHNLVDVILKCIPSVAKNDLDLVEELVDKTLAIMKELRARVKYVESLEKIYCNQVTSENVTVSSKSVVSEVYDIKFVYLITEGTSQKIGVAQDVEKRLIGMQTSCPYELKIVAAYAPTTLSAFDLERTLHLHYARNRLKGEWFSINLSAEEFREICETYDKIS